MKFFTLIFSFYLLALSVVPCSDSFNAGQNNQNEKTFSASHSHSTDSTDFCSSLCICNCCSSPVIAKFQATSITITKITILPQVNFPLRELSFVSTYTGNVWHPPQIIA